MKILLSFLLLIFAAGNNAQSQTCSVTISPNPAAVCIGSCITLTATATGTPPFSYTWTPATGLSNPNSPTPTACPIVTTNYTVTINDGTGCTATASATVIVNPRPITTISNADICFGSCTVLSAAGGVMYSWAPPNWLSCTNCCCPTACPTSTTTYSVIVTDFNGCTGTNSVTVTVYPLPFVSAGQDTLICKGSSAQLTSSSSGVSAYSWMPPAGLSNPILPNPVANPTTTTTYTVTVTDINACTNTATVTITVDTTCTIGITGAPASARILYFSPNPFNVTTVLTVPYQLTTSNNVMLYIYDVLGNKVQAIPIEREQTILRRENLPAGIYFYRLLRNDAVLLSGKVIIE